jgi:SAM-dependent methyltransferase
MGWKLPGILRFLPGPTVVPIAQIGKTLQLLPASQRVLDVGAGGRRITPGVVTVDAVAYPGVDIIADIHHLPMDDNSYDCIFCTGTLEHVRDPWRVIKEIQRVLKPGGIVHVDVPFIQGYHGDPTDFWRFTLDGLKLLCEGFQEIDSGTYIGPSSALVWITREWADSLTSNRILSNLMLIAVALLTAPFRYLDYLMIRGTRSHRIASAVFFRGRKAELPEFQVATSREKHSSFAAHV